jgi:hypothetical protein
LLSDAPATAPVAAPVDTPRVSDSLIVEHPVAKKVLAKIKINTLFIKILVGILSLCYEPITSVLSDSYKNLPPHNVGLDWGSKKMKL